MAAMANEASSSRALIAPRPAMIAETPQIDDPIASRLVSLGESLNRPPSQTISASAMAGTSSRKRRGNPIGCSSAVIAMDMTASPGNARQDGERDEKDERGGGENRPCVNRDGDAAGDRLL